jgi:hypothetical protein
VNLNSHLFQNLPSLQKMVKHALIFTLALLSAMLWSAEAKCCARESPASCCSTGSCNIFCCRCPGCRSQCGFNDLFDAKKKQDVSSILDNTRDTFNFIDGDKNGVINSTEALIYILGNNPQAARLAQASIMVQFLSMDANGDGVLQPNEFDSSL